MRLKNFLKYCLATGLAMPAIGIVLGGSAVVKHHYNHTENNLTTDVVLSVPDTGKKSEPKLPYPFEDNLTDPLSNKPVESPLYLSDPSNIRLNIDYDDKENQYNISEKIGDRYFRSPSYMTFDEFVRSEFRKSTKDYWKEITGSADGNNKRSIIPKIYVGGQAFDRIFGGNTIDIRPQGSAELTFGLNVYRNDNPAIPEKQRRNTTFDFNEKIQMNVVGNIGEKMKLTTNYNTEASFDFENKMKLEYTGLEDEIIKKIEAGNVSLPLSGSLIQGSQSLFGIKTQLQFGKLKVTTVISQQEGQSSTIDVPPGGGQQSNYEIQADQYEANKHYFISGYFKDNYDNALKNLPIINSPVNITKMEVWITNKNNNTENTRDIVAFMDLAEYNIFSNALVSQGTSVYPSNDKSNNLYALMNTQYLAARDINNVSQSLDPLAAPPYNFAPQQDYIRLVGARKLNQNEFTFHPKLGFISLNQALNSNEVLAVAFEYTIGNEVFTVGDLTTSGVNAPKALFVKLLKSTNINPKLPTWDLMMKNVYSLGTFQLSRENFRLNVIYNDNSDGLKKINYLPVPSTEVQLNGAPIIQVLGLDRLDQRNDPYSDGIFDFVEGVTINSNSGRVFFPVREPFGSYLRTKFTDPNLANSFVFEQLYDSTRTAAQQLPELNRFSLVGTYQSSSSSEIYLNAINIPQGSVVVTAGGVPLQENIDYTVDYNLGRVKIINAGILASATPIKISLESNSLFSIQSKSLYGARFDYMVNKDFNLGGTFLHLNERPITRKVNIGDEPIRNTIWGVDGTYTTNSGLITRLVDKLPFIETKAESKITVAGEFANLIPGTSRAIGKSGNAYIDDFEGSQSTIDIRNPGTWFTASIPQGQANLFPESVFNDSLISGYNRARLAWYNIDPTVFYRNNNSLLPPNITSADLSNHNVREVLETELFPFKQNQTGQATNINILNLAYYPSERGTNNFDVAPTSYSAGIDNNGLLNDPSTRWAGIMRRIETYDFETSNVEFIQFWVMDPFHDESLNNGSGGKLYFNLGDVSEDILKDSYRAFENGLPSPTNNATVDSTNWGLVPNNPSIVNAFDNDPASRAAQDVGLDGLSTDNERTYFKSAFLDQVENTFGQASPAYVQANADPSSDNFQYFRGTNLDNASADILSRYKRFNGTDGNSKTSEQSPEPYATSSTNIPDGEDINRDNTMTDFENYFQYEVNLTPGQMVVGTNYIVDQITTSVKTADNTIKNIKWYQFKIPVNSPSNVVGTGADLKSVNFIRMFMKDFDSPMVLRFARLELLRGEWRKYQYSLLSNGEFIPVDPGATPFDVTVVNLEENGDRTPIPYVLPPGIDREVNASSTNLQELNEQSLSLKVCNLEDGDARAAYKNTRFDVRNYNKIKMYLHAEDGGLSDELQDGEVTAFVRLGSDFVNNYYEYEIPLKITRFGATIDTDIWPEANNMEIDVDKLIKGKLARNNAYAANGNPYSIPYYIGDGNRKITIVGNPTLSEVKTIMIGVRNPKKELVPGDDGSSKCVVLWVNELRMNDFDNNGGWAANARVTAKLADLGNVTLSGARSTDGFGSLESKLNNRQKENISQYDLSTSLEFGRFLPQKAGLSLPLYFGISESFSNPQYNPLDPDVPFELALDEIDDPSRRSQLKKIAQDYTKRQSINLTNIKKSKTGGGKSRIWDIENFNLSLGYTQVFHRNINLEFDDQRDYLAALGYNYATQPKYITPFGKLKPLQKSKWLRLVKDFNFNLVPTNLTFRTDINRHYGETQVRDLSEFSFKQPITFNKIFTTSRQYSLQYDITRSIKFDFNANNLANIDEPFGKLDTEEKRDSVRKNFWNLGRNTDYRQNGSFSYNVPLSKLPLTDWIAVNAKYMFDYRWQTGPLSIIPQTNALTINPAIGNTIQNSNTRQVNTTLTFTTLYNKVPYFKKLLGPKPPKTTKPAAPAKPAAPDTTGGKKPKVKKQRQYTTLERAIAKVLFSTKNASLNFSETYGTILPGFNRTSELLGMNMYDDENGDMNFAPGLPFVFGSQTDIRSLAARNRWLTTDTVFNGVFSQTYTQSITGRATIEPVDGLRAELTINKSYARSSSENYRATLTGEYQPFTQRETGNFSMSFIAIRTAFAKDRKDYSSPVFDNFSAFRKEISLQLGADNPLSIGLDSAGYADGYGATSQEVLTYAFLAAYSGKTPGTTKFSAFPKLPQMNWRITYDGLSKLKFAQKLFRSVNISHGYRSTYGIASFNTSLLYKQDGSARDLGNNFIPKEEFGAVTITEQFSPLIGVDVNFKNNKLTTRFEYKRDRNISLSFTDIQISEVKGQEYVIGAGYRFRDFKLPFGLQKSKKKKGATGNDLNLTGDFSLRKNSTIIRRLQQNIDQPTAGLTILSFKLAADYSVNERFNVRLFFDKTINTPLISTSFPTANTAAGVSVRFTLAQ